MPQYVFVPLMILNFNTLHCQPPRGIRFVLFIIRKAVNTQNLHKVHVLDSRESIFSSVFWFANYSGRRENKNGIQCEVAWRWDLHKVQLFFCTNWLATSLGCIFFNKDKKNMNTRLKTVLMGNSTNSKLVHLMILPGIANLKIFSLDVLLQVP